MRADDTSPAHLRGPLARAAAACIEPLYAAAMDLRRLAYDRGWRSIGRAHVPVISVGNLTTGGTGKTPMVVYIAHTLRHYGIEPAVVLRGYGCGRGSRSDEEQLLSDLLPGAPVVANPDRLAAAELIAREHPNVRAIILDDGFQHRRIHRELDLVLIDATNPFGFDRILPRGLMRERPAALARAGAVVVSRADHLEADELAELDRRIAQHHGRPPIAHTTHSWGQVLDDQDRPVAAPTLLNPRNVTLFAAELVDVAQRTAPANRILSLGRPSAFLRQAGISDLPIQMTQSVVRKALQKHGLSTEMLASLPAVLNAPILVFDRQRTPEKREVLTELVHRDGHVLVAITLNLTSRGGAANDVRSIHHKSDNNLVDWINSGYTVWVSEGKIKSWLGRLAPTTQGQVRAALEQIIAAQSASDSTETKKPASSSGIGTPAGSGPLARYTRARVFVLAGIGNPQAFLDQAAARFTVVDGKLLPDHARYDRHTLADLRKELRGAQIDAVLTTEKDWVKLRPLLQSDPLPVPVWRPRLSIAFLDGEKELNRLLLAAVSRPRPAAFPQHSP